MRPGPGASGNGRVQLGQQRVNVLAVDIAGLLHRLAAGGRAAQTMHANLNEQGRGLRRGVQNIAENGVFGNGHGKIPP